MSLPAVVVRWRSNLDITIKRAFVREFSPRKHTQYARNWTPSYRFDFMLNIFDELSTREMIINEATKMDNDAYRRSFSKANKNKWKEEIENSRWN